MTDLVKTTLTFSDTRVNGYTLFHEHNLDDYIIMIAAAGASNPILKILKADNDTYICTLTVRINHYSFITGHWERSLFAEGDTNIYSFTMPTAYDLDTIKTGIENGIFYLRAGKALAIGGETSIPVKTT